MKQHFRDSLTLFGITLAVFGIWNSGIVKGVGYWVMTFGMIILFIASIFELFSPEA